jgi:DNA-directed RNA polymerase III subunit RPC4
MSKRLDSISRTSTPSGSSTNIKPSLKFKPKVVLRKSKEERENAGKINTPGINKIAEKNNNKKFLNNKKSSSSLNNNKLNKKLNGTQLVISGPLSEGTISLGGLSSNSNNNNNNNGNKNIINPLLERLKNNANASKEKKLKLKKENNEFNNLNDLDLDSDSDIDDNAIDMSKKFDNNGDHDNNNKNDEIDLNQFDTDLFPIRAERNEHREYGEESKIDNTIKTEFHNESSIIPSESNTRENTIDPKLADLIETETTIATEPKIENTETQNNLTNNYDENLHMNDYQEKQEFKQLNHDYNILSKSLKNLNFENQSNLGNMFFLQLPCSLPILENDVNGLIGKIRIHKSGKMTMKIGKVKFDVIRGGSSDFVQDVVLVDPINKTCYHVGNIKEKITAIPKIM